MNVLTLIVLLAVVVLICVIDCVALKQDYTRHFKAKVRLLLDRLEMGRKARAQAEQAVRDQLHQGYIRAIACAVGLGILLWVVFVVSNFDMTVEFNQYLRVWAWIPTGALFVFTVVRTIEDILDARKPPTPNLELV